MIIDFLTYLVIIFGVSALIVYLLNRLKIPSIVGFLIAGVLLGPHGLLIIKDVHTVEVFAEIGVILLMFTIGLEFSLQTLSLLRRSVFTAGTLQVVFTILIAGMLSFLFLGQTPGGAIFDGFLVALSSTAIVIKLLMERAEINTPHGRNTIGILIFQDLCVVPFMLLIPILAGQGGGLTDIAFTILKAVVVVSIVVFLARWGVPHILHEVVKSKSRELFLITIILLCLATALLTQKLGLSLALGAFLAGIVISESEYASQAISDVIPFKESFMGLFFISVGMLLDISFMIQHITLVLSLVVIILLTKVITASLAAAFVCGSVRHSVQTGFYIAQIGEFSFVLAQAGKELSLIDANSYQIFLCASVLTMMLTPFMISFAGKPSQWLSSKKILKRLERFHERHAHHDIEHKSQKHVIIVGFGVNGRNLASALKTSGIPYAILELNPSTVKKMKKSGEPIYFGDSTSQEVLHKVGLMTADMLVVAISDAASTRKTVQITRNERKDIHILVRTRFVAEVDELLKLGANEVIPEEFETSVEIFSRVLHHYHIPINVIHEYIDTVRSDNYKALRTTGLQQKGISDRQKFISELLTETYLIKDNSHVCGFSIRELNIRKETGATIIAIKRDSKIIQNPSPEVIIQPNDVLLLIGTKEQLLNSAQYLSSDHIIVKQYH